MHDDRKARMRSRFRDVCCLVDMQTKKDASGRLMQSLMTDQTINRRITMCYMATRHELDLHELIVWLRSCGHTVCVPRIRRDLSETDGDDSGDSMMDAVCITPQTQRSPNQYNILEPIVTGDDVVCRAVTTVLVPGLAFDDASARLGNGGGYYDRWLASHTYDQAIGVCYACQIAQSGAIPMESHDVWMDRVVSA